MNIFKLSLLIGVILLVVSGVVIVNLPQGLELPIHWNIDGEVDRMVNADLALLAPPLMIFFIIGLLAILKYIEPRKTNLAHSTKAINAVCMTIVLLASVMEGGYLALLAGLSFSMHLLVIFTVGLALMIIGNYLSKARSNFFIGIRTPWTLSSENVWRKTHRLGGRLITIAGAITALLCWFIPNDALGYLITAVVLPAAIFPTIYSWWLWRNEQLDHHS
ncbi:SdpI family protein [Thalassotalea sp. G2M2-11]|uniref:SdpI family protein n=1 Tax=Thalassotalea sp. G2M2-11 TaxID=2787627 RepID=UPI0019CFBB49|nr:SdpI family protein [Thalassotalea sp. G2M2-11]